MQAEIPDDMKIQIRSIVKCNGVDITIIMVISALIIEFHPLTKNPKLNNHEEELRE